MDRVALLQKYQELDTDGWPLGRKRTNREYAEILGIHESYLSKCYDGKQIVGMKALEGLARAFPVARPEIAAVIGLPGKVPA